MNPTADGSGADAIAAPSILPGETVTIFALGQAGPYIEGGALTEAVCAEPHYFRVRFLGEKAIRIRFVHPNWQAEPQRCLALLRQFWHAATSPPSFDDFFPDDTE